MSTSTSLHRRRLRPDLISEACDWFVEFRTDDASETSCDRFDAWLRQSPDHIQAYLEVAAAWSEVPTSEARGRIDVAALIRKARASHDDGSIAWLRPGAHPSDEKQLRSAAATSLTGPSRHWSLAASVVAFCLAVGGALWFWQSLGDSYSTGEREQRLIRLADGSIIELNARTSIRVRLSPSMRRMDLSSGEAYFRVAKDASRPFLVREDDVTVRAVGTQFNVKRSDSAAVVTVVEGRVVVLPNAKASADQRPAGPGGTPGQGTAGATPGDESATAPVYVSAGEQVLLSAGVASRPRAVDAEAASAWAQRSLVFDETPLAEAAAVFNRYSVRQLVIDDPVLAHRRITGTYSSANIDALIKFLRLQPGIEVRENERQITVHARGPAAKELAPGPSTSL